MAVLVKFKTFLREKVWDKLKTTTPDSFIYSYPELVEELIVYSKDLKDKKKLRKFLSNQKSIIMSKERIRTEIRTENVAKITKVVKTKYKSKPIEIKGANNDNINKIEETIITTEEKKVRLYWTSEFAQKTYDNVLQNIEQHNKIRKNFIDNYNEFGKLFNSKVEALSLNEKEKIPLELLISVTLNYLTGLLNKIVANHNQQIFEPQEKFINEKTSLNEYQFIRNEFMELLNLKEKLNRIYTADTYYIANTWGDYYEKMANQLEKFQNLYLKDTMLVKGACDIDRAMVENNNAQHIDNEPEPDLEFLEDVRHIIQKQINEKSNLK